MYTYIFENLFLNMTRKRERERNMRVHTMTQFYGSFPYISLSPVLSLSSFHSFMLLHLSSFYCSFSLSLSLFLCSFYFSTIVPPSFYTSSYVFLYSWTYEVEDYFSISIKSRWINRYLDRIIFIIVDIL